MRPLIGAAEATSNTLLGVRNELDPEAREDMRTKYKATFGTTTSD